MESHPQDLPSRLRSALWYGLVCGASAGTIVACLDWKLGAGMGFVFTFLFVGIPTAGLVFVQTLVETRR